MKQLILAFIFTLTLCTSALAQNQTDNSFTITTYYPSPYGVYRNMRLYPSNEPTGPAVDRGVMYYDNSTNIIKFYNGSAWLDMGGGYWVQSGNNIYYNIIGGNVGIGTGASTPLSQLHVDGDIQLNNANHVNCDAAHIGRIRFDGTNFWGCTPGGDRRLDN
jgi:hypothetical protein